MVKSRKSLITILVVISLMLLSGFLLVGCNETSGDYEPSLKIYSSFKTEYSLYENLDVSGGVLEYIDENGKTSHVSIEENFVTDFDSSSVGIREMTITYKDVSIKVSYTINPEFALLDTYYLWVDTSNPVMTYSYAKITSDDKVVVITVLEPDVDSPTGAPMTYNITSKEIIDGKWVIKAEIAEAFEGGYAEKMEIVVNNQNNFSMSLWSNEGVKVPMALEFSKVD